MFSKDQFMEIQVLDTVLICQLEDAHFDSYCDDVHSFTEKFPEQETKVKDALKAKDHGALKSSVTTINGMMKKIHAKELAEKTSALLTKIEEAAHDELQSLAIDIIKSISMLSIDLQMLEYKNKPGDKEYAEEKAYENPPEKSLEEMVGAVTTEAPAAEEKPVAEQPKPAPVTTKATSATASSIKEENTGGNSVLAVDDTSFFLATIKSFLSDSGYRVTCINGGRQALNFLKNNTPDLFILDIEMPEMDGFELAENIRSMGITKPIIFLTGNSKTDAVQRAIKVGANDFIIKPVNKAQLLERIGRYLEPDFTYYDYD
ncbi:MAG: response regulator [Oscillospiraceae bacterium]|jgi:CheY-like chemotaxis protein|nr:response regulator [Oscillospiraceae bacterium]